MEGKNAKNYILLALSTANDSKSTISVNEIEHSVIRVTYNGKDPKEAMDEDCSRRLNHFLIEFGTYCVSKSFDQGVTLSSMLSHFRLNEFGIDMNFSQARLSTTWKQAL